MQGSILQPHFRSGCVRKGKGRRRARHCWRSRSDHGKRGASSPGPDLACQMRTENRAARAPGMAREALRMPGTPRPPCRLPPRPAAGAPEPRAERGCRSRAGRAALRRDVPQAREMPVTIGRRSRSQSRARDRPHRAQELASGLVTALSPLACQGLRHGNVPDRGVRLPSLPGPDEAAPADPTAARLVPAPAGSAQSAASSWR